MASTILRIDYVRVEAVQASLEVLVDERGFRTGRGAHTDESEHKLDSPILLGFGRRAILVRRNRRRAVAAAACVPWSSFVGSIDRFCHGVGFIVDDSRGFVTWETL